MSFSITLTCEGTNPFVFSPDRKGFCTICDAKTSSAVSLCKNHLKEFKQDGHILKKAKGPAICLNAELNAMLKKFIFVMSRKELMGYHHVSKFGHVIKPMNFHASLDDKYGDALTAFVDACRTIDHALMAINKEALELNELEALGEIKLDDNQETSEDEDPADTL